MPGRSSASGRGRVLEILAEEERDQERRRDSHDHCDRAGKEEPLERRARDEAHASRSSSCTAGPGDRRRDRGGHEPDRLGRLHRDRVDPDRGDPVVPLEDEELDPVRDQVDHLDGAHHERERRIVLPSRSQIGEGPERQPDVAR